MVSSPPFPPSLSPLPPFHSLAHGHVIECRCQPVPQLHHVISVIQLHGADGVTRGPPQRKRGDEGAGEGEKGR